MSYKRPVVSIPSAIPYASAGRIWLHRCASLFLHCFGAHEVTPSPIRAVLSVSPHRPMLPSDQCRILISDHVQHRLAFLDVQLLGAD